MNKNGKNKMINTAKINKVHVNLVISEYWENRKNKYIHENQCRSRNGKKWKMF